MQHPTVLVVEADPAIRRLFADLLRSEGYRVRLLEQSALSAQQIAAAHPNLLLLEITVGTTARALEVIEQLQLQPATAALPILLSTTDSQLVERHRAALRQSGCAILLKPFDVDELLGMVQQNLAGQACSL